MRSLGVLDSVDAETRTHFLRARHRRPPPSRGNGFCLAVSCRDEERLKVVLPLSLRLCNGAAVNASDEAANGEEDAESDFNTANGKTRLSLLSLLAHLAELLPREVYGHFILPQLLFVATEDPLVAVRCSALRFIAAVGEERLSVEICS